LTALLRFSAEASGRNPSKWLFDRDPKIVKVTFRSSVLGNFEDTLELYFFDVSTKTKFTILRKARVTVGSSDDHELLKPKAPYVKSVARPRLPRGHVVGLRRPEIWSEAKWVTRLSMYKIPSALADAASSRNAHNVVKQQHMPDALHLGTYTSYFNTLLWIEEERQA
jgi:helicase MOV-10